MSIDENRKWREEARRLAVNISEAHWKLAPVLVRIWEDGMWGEWGFKTWHSYIESDLNVSIRTAQHIVQMGIWHRSMSVACQEWARSVPWTKIRVIHTAITHENWKEWRKIVQGRTVSELATYLNVQNQLAIKKAASEGALLRIREVGPSELLTLRRGGLSAAKIAVQTGIEIKDIRAIAPFVASFIPRDVHERIVRMALENRRTVSDEVASALCAAFSENSVRKVS